MNKTRTCIDKHVFCIRRAEKSPCVQGITVSGKCPNSVSAWVYLLVGVKGLRVDDHDMQGVTVYWTEEATVFGSFSPDTENRMMNFLCECGRSTLFFFSLLQTESEWEKRRLWNCAQSPAPSSRRWRKKHTKKRVGPRRGYYSSVV